MHATTSLLIIDDEQDFCELVLSILRRDSFLIECAYTIREALKLLTARKPDFILLDNNLPDGKGIVFLQEHNSLFTKSRVIMMTADASDYLRQTALECGVHEFLIKPFSITKLRELICPVPDNV